MKKIKTQTLWLILSITILTIVILTVTAFYLTKQLWFIPLGAFAFISVILLLFLQRRKYENDLIEVTDVIDEIIKGTDIESVNELDDILKTKIRHQLVRLNRIITTNKDKAEKDKEEIRDLIGEIAHQLRMPLSNIQAYTELLKDDSITREEKDKYIDAVEQSETKLTFLIDSFIKMSRLENRIIQIRKTDADLTATLTNAIKQAERLAAARNITIKFDEDSIPPVKHDRNWLGEAVFNLLDNGIKYSDEGSIIETTFTENEMFVGIEVRNRGEGIDKSEKEKIFKRFFRGSNVDNQEGFGIGLYITKEIITRHEGFIRVKSHDDGTSFIIYLPFPEKQGIVIDL